MGRQGSVNTCCNLLRDSRHLCAFPSYIPFAHARRLVVQERESALRRDQGVLATERRRWEQEAAESRRYQEEHSSSMTRALRHAEEARSDLDSRHPLPPPSPSLSTACSVSPPFHSSWLYAHKALLLHFVHLVVLFSLVLASIVCSVCRLLCTEYGLLCIVCIEESPKRVLLGTCGMFLGSCGALQDTLLPFMLCSWHPSTELVCASRAAAGGLDRFLRSSVSDVEVTMSFGKHSRRPHSPHCHPALLISPISDLKLAIRNSLFSPRKKRLLPAET